jgi:hypothetical protein
MDACLARDAALQAEALVNTTSAGSLLLSVTPSFLRLLKGDSGAHGGHPGRAGPSAKAPASPLSSSPHSEEDQVVIHVPSAAPAGPPQLSFSAAPEEHQERNALDLAELVRLARDGAAGAALSDGLAAHEARMRGHSVFLRSSDKAQVDPQPAPRPRPALGPPPARAGGEWARVAAAQLTRAQGVVLLSTPSAVASAPGPLSP